MAFSFVNYILVRRQYCFRTGIAGILGLATGRSRMALNTGRRTPQRCMRTCSSGRRARPHCCSLIRAPTSRRRRSCSRAPRSRCRSACVRSITASWSPSPTMSSSRYSTRTLFLSHFLMLVSWAIVPYSHTLYTQPVQCTQCSIALWSVFCSTIFLFMSMSNTFIRTFMST